MKFNKRQQAELGHLVKGLGRKRVAKIFNHCFHVHGIKGHISLDTIFYDYTIFFSLADLDAFENRAKNFGAKYSPNPIKFAIGRIVKLVESVIETNK